MLLLFFSLKKTPHVYPKKTKKKKKPKDVVNIMCSEIILSSYS